MADLRPDDVGSYSGKLLATDASGKAQTEVHAWNFEVLPKPATHRNSEEDTYIAWAVTLGVLLVALILVVVRSRYLKYELENAPTDFDAEMVRLQDTDELGTVKWTFGRVPRELKRGWVNTIEVLGHGNFGEVYKALLDDASNPDVPEYGHFGHRYNTRSISCRHIFLQYGYFR